jgi:uncharacterized protein YjeT (DUF2065 family)
MLNIDFWFMFIGFLLVVATVPAFLSPSSFKSILKGLFKEENHLRSVSTWYLLVGPLAAYSGWTAGSFWEANLILIVGVLFMIQGILLFFATEWYQNTLLKPILKLTDSHFKLGGLAMFVVALSFLYYGFFFL